MNPLLKFNVFEKADWTKDFQTHIANTLKRPECWNNCAPMFKLMQDSRNEFDFAAMNHNLKVDSTWLIKIAKLEEYLRIVNFLSSRFKFGKSKDAVQNFKSKWCGA